MHNREFDALMEMIGRPREPIVGTQATPPPVRETANDRHAHDRIIFAVIILGILWWGASSSCLPLIPMGEPFRTIRARTDLVVRRLIIILWIIWQLLLAAGSCRPCPFGSEPRSPRWSRCRLIRRARPTSAEWVLVNCVTLRCGRSWPVWLLCCV